MPKIKVSDIEMYYEEKGKGDPLLITTGWALGTRWWRRAQCGSLRRKLPVLRPGPSRHGRIGGARCVLYHQDHGR